MRTSAIWLLAALGCGHTAAAPPPLTRNLDQELLEAAVRWPNPSIPVVMGLATQYLASGRDQTGHHYFCERAGRVPDRPLFLALCGMFQARMATQVPLLRRVSWVEDALAKMDRAAALDGLARYLRGLVGAQLPDRFGRAQQARDDLQWMLANAASFPPGLRRGAYLSLATLHRAAGRTSAAEEMQRRAGGPLRPGEPLILNDLSITRAGGARFSEASLTESAPGVWVARGFDFGDIGFVATAGGIVAIDAGTTEANARAALASLRRVNRQPIRTVILTHAHWDHIGGLRALLAPDTEVIAQARFGEELALINAISIPFRFFFGAGTPGHLEVVPQRLVSRSETMTIGGVRFGLHPVRGGETMDALLVHLPDQGVVFVGDVFMPYLGAPFLSEGSPEGLFEAIDVIQGFKPRLLIHGHPPLTDFFRIDVIGPLGRALRVVDGATRAAVRAGKPLAEALNGSLLPREIEHHPDAVWPFLLMRESLIKRVYDQSFGYWQVDGDGLEVFSPGEWAAAVDLISGGREEPLVRAATALSDRGDFGMSLRVADWGLRAHPGSALLASARRRALDGLRAKHQFNPFKFIIYSELAGLEQPGLGP
jgi:glyoxylase-like metal-dependent hydrolase (beta-lactamase superfamily II)